MPIVTEEKCARLCRIIQKLMNEKQEVLAKQILKAFAFDPIDIMERLDGLQSVIATGSAEDIKTFIGTTEERQSRRGFLPR